MLQDLSFGHLDNQYHESFPQEKDILLCMRGGDILIHRDSDNRLTLPTWQQAEQSCKNWHTWGKQNTQFVFSMQERNYYLWMGEAGDIPGFSYESAASLRQTVSKDICFAAMTGWHLFTWYRNNQFCGRCGKPTEHDHRERMMRCPACGNTIYPRISPAVIIAVTDGDRLLLSKYANRAYTRYALLAGFTEIGETAEQTVEREVMEEVGLKVRNIRYYKSQPWGMAQDILMGFYCEADGDDPITMDEKELKYAEWVRREEIKLQPNDLSLTNEMMRMFKENRIPQR